MEKIIDYRVQDHTEEWLVKWEHFEHEYNTWEPRQNLENNIILNEYEEQRLAGKVYKLFFPTQICKCAKFVVVHYVHCTLSTQMSFLIWFFLM